MIFIRRNKDPYGWMGNMSAYPVTYEGKEYRTTEALFQALRFDNEEIIEAIRAERSPMGAKMKAKKNKEAMVIEPMGEKDLDNMRLCLRIKVEQHPELLEELKKTGNEEILEDCTKRPRGSGLFWGAANQNDEWVGENWLGKLWMELRNEQ